MCAIEFVWVELSLIRVLVLFARASLESSLQASSDLLSSLQSFALFAGCSHQACFQGQVWGFHAPENGCHLLFGTDSSSLNVSYLHDNIPTVAIIQRIVVCFRILTLRSSECSKPADNQLWTFTWLEALFKSQGFTLVLGPLLD